ncbi:CitMHS family transporter [Alkalihalobacillus sp. NPDC078783]
MLTVIGLLIIITIVGLLMWGKISPVVGMVLIPIIGAFAAGFGPADISAFFESGINSVMNVVIMFIFAILFFGIMQDTGVFNPLISGLIKVSKGNVVTVAACTAIVGAVAHLDGAGATTFLFTIPALLPLYKKLHMSRYLLLLIIATSASVMNMVPWAGPTGRVASVIGGQASDVWRPLIPIQIIGLVMIILLAIFLGFREKRRIARKFANGEIKESHSSDLALQEQAASVEESSEASLLRPKLIFVNIAIMVLTVFALLEATWEPPLIFMVALGVTLLINYPNVKTQMERIKAHSPSALSMASVILAAGVFLGVIRESGMLEAIALSLIDVLPSAVIPNLHIIIGLLGVPLDLLTSTDAYYFALLPIAQEITSQFGVSAASTAYAMLIGNVIGTFVSPFSPALWLGIGLAGAEMGKHIRYSFLWMWGFSIVLVLVAVAIGVI